MANDAPRTTRRAKTQDAERAPVAERGPVAEPEQVAERAPVAERGQVAERGHAAEREQAAGRGQVVEIWKASIEAQRHFYDIGMRIRTMFIAVILALLAATGFLLAAPFSLAIGSVNIRFATLMPLFGILGTLLFYFMDRYWYHRLLVASVKQTNSIEGKYRTQIPELSLSEAIGSESAYSPLGWTRWLANQLVSHDTYKQTGQLHSDGKIELFYKSVLCVLAGTTLLLILFGGVSVSRPDATPVVEQVEQKAVEPIAAPTPSTPDAASPSSPPPQQPAEAPLKQEAPAAAAPSSPPPQQPAEAQQNQEPTAASPTSPPAQQPSEASANPEAPAAASPSPPPSQQPVEATPNQEAPASPSEGPSDSAEPETP